MLIHGRVKLVGEGGVTFRRYTSEECQHASWQLSNKYLEKNRQESKKIR